MSQVYTTAEGKLLRGAIDLVNDDVRAMLVKQSFVFNAQHLHVFDVLDYEVSGNNYSRRVLTGKTVTVDILTASYVFRADNPTWSRINAGPVGGVVLFKKVNNDGDSDLVAFYGFSKVTEGGDLTVKWHSDGTIRLRNSP